MIEVLTVEHSEEMCNAISDILNYDPDIHMIGSARNGFEAIRKIKEFAPDVVLLNLEISGIDSIDVIKELEEINPVPVVLVSSLNDEHSRKLTDESFEEIVVEFILRPENPADLKKIANELREKVKSAAESNLRKVLPEKKLRINSISSQDKIIVIASSTGGPSAVSYILSSMPENIPCPIIVVQHMPEIFTKSFAERLNSVCEIEVKEAEKGEELIEGVAYIAPGDFHLEIKRQQGSKIIVLLNKKKKQLGVRPNADITMRTASAIFKEATIGVVLTGMGHDGTNGAKFIKRHEGTVIIQSKKTCVIYGMPGSIFKTGYYDLVLDLGNIPVALAQLMEI